MLQQHFKRIVVRNRIHANPISHEIENFVTYLSEQGYGWKTLHMYVRAAEHFGSWLGASRHAGQRIVRSNVNRFLDQHLPTCNCPRPAPRDFLSSRAALVNLLRSLGRYSTKPQPKKYHAAYIEEFRNHMGTNGGLAERTIQAHVEYAQLFLEKALPHEQATWNEVRPQDVSQFMLEFLTKHKPSTAAIAASAIRCLLRYVQMRGLIDTRLVAAVPPIRKWKHSSVPKTMSEEQLLRFLESFDRSKITGCRDYAMALLMTHLGLRVSEVCELHLGDVDWKSGIICVYSTKQRRARELPLISIVGSAIAKYVKSARPHSDYRKLFLRSGRCVGMPISREVVRSVMRTAYRRSGCNPAWAGTHVLRHTAASRLIQRGATIKEIADVLGHTSIDTSLIYTKVNTRMLASVALPWPENAS